MREMNKRGQQMTLGTIIAIVLGIAVLVFLIFGFSTGWNNLWDKVGNINSGKSNVDAVVQGCAVACSSQGVDAFCRQLREVDYGDGTSNTGSCETFLKKKSTLRVKIEDCSIDCTPVTVPSLDGGKPKKIADAKVEVAAAQAKYDASKVISDKPGATAAQKETTAADKVKLDAAEKKLTDAENA
jgi:hypothetical protein